MDNAEASPQQPQPQQEVPDLVKVVNRAAHIENLMDQVISNYCAPRKKASTFMWTVLLDSSVMPLGGKAKVVAAVAQMVGCTFERNAVHRIIALRNAFAHNSTDAHQAVVFGRTDEETYSYCQFMTLGPSGEIKIEKRHEAFAEFNDLFTVVKQSLLQLREAVKKDLETEDFESQFSPRIPIAKPKPLKESKPQSKKN